MYHGTSSTLASEVSGDQRTSPDTASGTPSTGATTPRARPAVIGIYGLPAAGKTFLLNQLKSHLGEDTFHFCDGSAILSEVVPNNDLAAFKRLSDSDKLPYRETAIRAVAAKCADEDKAGVVAGHLMFWAEGAEPEVVYTPADLEVYTHIIYLDTPCTVIRERCLRDTTRKRHLCSTSHLWQWQHAEKSALRDLCLQNGILFTAVRGLANTQLERVTRLLHDFSTHREDLNAICIDEKLDSFMATLRDHGKLQKVLVFDADKTLIPGDTGTLFFEALASKGHADFTTPKDPLKEVFSSPMGYSYTAFHQVALLYEEAAASWGFDEICATVASRVAIHPEILSFVQKASAEEHVAVVVVTCGLSRIWEKVLENHGLSFIPLIAGGLLSDGFIIVADAKAAIVSRLQDKYGAYVWAFGDSVLDIPMLKRADDAIVVVNEKGTRSKRMDSELLKAINDGLKARQVLLPSHASPRLDPNKLPTVQLTEAFMEQIIGDCTIPLTQRLHDATPCNASKILATAMRDASTSGPALRGAHGRAGEYLATHFLADMFGTEAYPIEHVQGRATNGHRLCGESRIVIAALMRGGEPMAYGVNEIFPQAMFIHPFNASDIKEKHVHEREAVFLVDSVINSGKSVVEFVQRIRWLNHEIRIVVVAGVVQEKALSQGPLARLLRVDNNLHIVFLRKSENKFIGKGGTDTGNRLFNTTEFD